jgi:stage II sporulation protein D
MRLARAAAAALLLTAAPAAWAQPSAESIRVAVVREDPQIALQVYGRFRVRAVQTGATVQEGRRLPETAVKAMPQGLAFGEQLLPVPAVRIEPASDAAISVNGRRLRGAVEITRQRNQKLLVINHVALEDYLRGVLSKEAPDYWPEEALRAIAIAARTYAVYQRFSKAAAPYDVTADVMSQDYGGRSAEKHATTRAVKATSGLILMYHGGLFPTFYHSTCGGTTEHARVMGKYDIIPLQGGLKCDYCTASPFYAWQRHLTREDVNWALHKSHYGSIGKIRDMRVTKTTASGRVQEVTITGAKRALKMTGYDLRALFGFDRIRSPLLTIEPTADGFMINGHGWGHGVGMCQWGAAELARRGISAPEILRWYYPESDLVSVKDLANQHVTIIGGPL